MAFARARLALLGVVLAVLATAPVARAAGSELTEAEIAELYAGDMVVRKDNVERDGRHYIGGMSYVMIDAPAEQVIDALDDAGTYRQILPRTRSVRWLGIARNGDAIIELEQGNAVAHGKYAVRIRRDRSDRDLSSAIIRFWLDHRFPHDIADANGFFRVESMGDRTLLTYLVMVDLGPGFWGQMFEGRIRRAALSTPMLVKKYVESHPPAPGS